MRTLIINTACAALLVTGCGSKSGQSLVVVSVDADAQLNDVATLHARATVGATTREFDVHPTTGGALSIPPAQTFGIDLPHGMTGSLALHVDALDSTGAVTASGDGSGPILAGARADISIHLAAGAANDLGGEPANLAGVAVDMAQPPGDMVVVPPAMLTIDKTTQSFGDIVVGKTSTTASFLVVNGGGMPTSVATLTPGGANLSEFTIDTDCGPSLAPGGRCHVTASVAPTSAGMKTATFSLAATQGGSVGGTLTANALTAGAVKIMQASGNCGSSLVGTQSTTVASFTVQNTGASPTTALTVNTSDAQFKATGCAGSTLDAGGMCTVTVKFTPTSAGTQNASLTVTATTGGTDTASLVGVGLKPASLSISPSSATYTAVARNSTGGSTTFTISNSGDVNSVSLGTATLSGSNASSFSITTDNCKGAPVGPSPGKCTIVVQFKPLTSGTNTASLNVPSAGLTSPTLTGTGTPIWVAETAPSGTPKLTSVWATDRQNVYAVGVAGSVLFRNSAGAWSTQSIGTTTDLAAVSGAASTNVFVAGGDVYQSPGNGTWSSQLSSEPYTGVWAVSSADIWATWDTGYVDPNNGNGVYHYTPGTGWKLARDSGNAALHGSTHAWASSSSDVFIYGGYWRFNQPTNSFVTAGSIYHLDGASQYTTQFNQSLQVAPQDYSMAVRSLWGSGSPANNLYAVTTTFSGPGFGTPSETILHSAGDGVWNQMPSPAPQVECDAVWGYDASHVFFGCTDGIHMYDGSAWSTSLASTSTFYGISGSSSPLPDAYAVGVASDGTTGVIYHYY